MTRIGPDVLTHFLLYNKWTMKKLCKKFFWYFGNNSEFRPMALAVNCNLIWIGNNVVIRPFSVLIADGKIIIEDNVLLGCGVHIYTSNHRHDKCKPIIEQGYEEPKDVIIGRGSWIGANSIILPGVAIGENAVVGAGSIITKDVPKNSTYIGKHERLIKER